jgi:hypothetical protein
MTSAAEPHLALGDPTPATATATAAAGTTAASPSSKLAA